jgi:hypothetical protein
MSGETPKITCSKPFEPRESARTTVTFVFFALTTGMIVVSMKGVVVVQRCRCSSAYTPASVCGIV